MGVGGPARSGQGLGGAGFSVYRGSWGGVWGG